MHLTVAAVATFLPIGIYLFKSELHERVYRKLSRIARQAPLQYWALLSLTPWPLVPCTDHRSGVPAMCRNAC